MTTTVKKDGRGGPRPGSGRPRKYPEGTRHCTVTITETAYARIKDVANKTEYVSNLILAQK